VAHARQVFEEDPPPILYHYTTQAGLLGIFQTREIWATHTQYLNDVHEFRHALKIYDDELHKLENDPTHADRKELLAQMEQSVKGLGAMNVCVCSFSEDGDILSQWRAYGGHASGFSVGFSGAFLRSVSTREQFWLVRCIYSEEQQRELMRTLLEDVLAENVQARAQGKDQRPGGNLPTYLNRYAPILKDPSFSEEREWRIITRPMDCHLDRYAFRPGRSMLLPYFRIPLEGDGRPLEVESVIVGPTPHEMQARRVVHSLALKYGLDGVKVVNTKIPYRSW
jgi:hypothetical protein